jgi:sulfite reductase beta subunit-like hemoprotein
VFVRGSLDRPAAIGRPVFRRVPTAELDDVVVGLVEGWIAARGSGESFRSFCDRHGDDDLGRLAGREPVRAKEVAEV